MSDALTDILRDEKLIEKYFLIRKMQENFISEPCHKTANEIIEELNILLTIPRGYKKIVNKHTIQELISNYNGYLDDEYTAEDF